MAFGQCLTLSIASMLAPGFQMAGLVGRGGGIRTPTRGFGDRWSTVQPTPLRSPSGDLSILLDFAVHLVFPAVRTEFFEFQTLSGCFLILGTRIVTVFALSTLKSDDIARHNCSLLNDLGDGSGAHGASAFANRKPQPLVHGHRRDQLYRQVYVVSRHHHLGPFRQLRHS